jgi:hypothetical protein
MIFSLTLKDGYVKIPHLFGNSCLIWFGRKF